VQADAGSPSVSSEGPLLLEGRAELLGAAGDRSPTEEGALCQPLMEFGEKKLGLPRTHLPFICKTGRAAPGKVQIHFELGINKILLCLYGLC